MTEGQKGVLAMVGCSTIWGLSGIYYKALAHVPPLEVLSHRTLWSLVFFAGVLAVQGRAAEVRSALGQRRNWVVLSVTATMIATNWFGFIFAVQSGRALEASLGYYIFPLVAVLAYCVGMALFTIIMGNAFAAFPVITLGIGLPLIVQQHHGDPAIMAAIGMLSGYCGTLLTPMAANFNLVPALLLELPDKHAVIKAQAPLAVVILAANIALMYFCVFRF